MTSLFTEARLGKAVDPQQCLPLVEQISASLARNGSALLGPARLKTKDEYTYMHSVAVCALMVALARQLGLPRTVQEAGMAGLLHDIGKMAMPLDVLNKPGKLSDDEYAIMRSHPERGHAMLLAALTGVSDAVLDVCLHHHERSTAPATRTGWRANGSACWRAWARSATCTTQSPRIARTKRLGTPRVRWRAWPSGRDISIRACCMPSYVP